MTTLEEEYNKDGLENNIAKIHDLVKLLQEERDSWLFNAKQLQKQVDELEIKLRLQRM